MSQPTLDIDAYIDAAAALVGVPIAPVHRPGITQHLTLAAEMAKALNEVELDDAELAMASVYSPPFAS